MGSVTKVANGYRARWRTPEGASRSKTFPTKGRADAHIVQMEHDKLSGAYVDPTAGKVPFQQYADQWLEAQTFDRITYDLVAARFRLSVYPVIGSKHLNRIKPSTIQTWIRSMGDLAPNTQNSAFVYVSAVFRAAVDDSLIARNPCVAPSVRRPRPGRTKVEPWSFDQVEAMASALPRRYGVVAVLGAGLGLRQGEIFGLATEDVDFLRGTVEVRRQVKLFNDGRQVFAPPKGGKTRTVPLAPAIRDRLAAHLAQFPARPVTLPWISPEGKPVSVDLICTSSEGNPLVRSRFNEREWKPALVQAGIPVHRANGCHALRHHFASVLLDGGESIKAVSSYLGHSDEGFTLRTYTHLMPSSEERTRKAINAVWRRVTDVSQAGE